MWSARQSSTPTYVRVTIHATGGRLPWSARPCRWPAAQTERRSRFTRFFRVTALSKRISRGLVLDGTSPGTGAASPAPGRRACASLACPAPVFGLSSLPCDRGCVSTDRMRTCAWAEDSVRYRHAFFQVMVERRQRPASFPRTVRASPFLVLFAGCGGTLTTREPFRIYL